MLTTLRIKNLALVNDLTLEFQPGYNVITGETGAGKSILIGALNLVLGERADRTLVRAGSESCCVEAVFDVEAISVPLQSLLEQNGLEPCENQQLVLKRSFSTAGMNRQFVNGSPTSLTVLAALGEWLVDIHGPHEHQSLLRPVKQLAILDAFGKLEQARETFAEILRRRTALEAEKAALVVDEKTYAQQLDLLRFQANEISSAALKPEDEEQLEADYARANNAARLLQLSRSVIEMLNENENSLFNQAGLIGRTLQELKRLDGFAERFSAIHEEMLSFMRELHEAVSDYSEKLDLDPTRLQQLEERINLLHSLKRKYGASINEVTAFGEAARRKLRALEQRDTELARLNRNLEMIEAELNRAGAELSSKRRKLIPQLNQAVSRQLADLGFRQSRFDALLAAAQPCNPSPDSPAKTRRLTQHGFDEVEFQFAPNPGEPPRPLRAIASSGELARVMLALKTVLAAVDQVPVLVFDEVDANVGGETANAIGEKMQQIARSRQVLCITHLPQVAAAASTHYVAIKQVKQGRTISEIVRLEKNERVTELARMLGGKTEAARKHAEALLALD